MFRADVGEEGWESVSALIFLEGMGDLRVVSMVAASKLKISESIESRRGRKTGSYSKSSSRLRLGFQLGLRIRE